MWRRSGGVGMPVGLYAGLVSYEGDLPAPVTSYASAQRTSPVTSVNYVPATNAWTRSAVVNRIPRRAGLRYSYGYGTSQMPAPYPSGGNRAVSSSRFQPRNGQLVAYSQNDAWFAAGYPSNLGLTFKVPQLRTQVTGGAGPGSMAQRPLFTRVQRVKRYSTYAPTFKTQGAKS